MKKLKYLFLLVSPIMLTFCSNDDNNSIINPIDNTQNQNPIVKNIGKYPEKLLFNSEPEDNIKDYGAYYYITQKNNRYGKQITWLVDYNFHNRKKDTYFEIISMDNDGLIKLNGYYEVTDSRGNWIYGDGPDYNVDFSEKGVITSSQHPLHIFYYE